jgi:hypothetical protein
VYRHLSERLEAASEARSGMTTSAALALTLSILLGAVGAGLIAATGLVPYEWVRHWLDAFAADGSANAYTAAIHAGIVRRLRYAGLGLMLLGALLYTARHRLAAAGRAFAASTTRLLHDVVREVCRAWTEASTGHRVALLAVLATGIGIRLSLLAGWPMRYDEAFTFLNYARDPLILGLTRYDMPNNHLFHTFLVHVAYRLLGDAPWALRVPAFLGGLFVMPATYLTVRVLYRHDAALLATALVATSMAGIEISTYARGYSTVTVLFLALLCLGAYLRRTGSAAGWALFVGLGALALYTVPTGLYAIATVVGWLVLEAWAGDGTVAPRRFALHLALAVAATALLTALLYAPILIRTDLVTLIATNPIVAIKVSPVPLNTFLAGNAAKLADTWARWASDRALWLQAVWLVGIAVALVLHRRVGRHRVPLVAGLLLGCAPVLLAQRVVPPSRVWVFLLPVFAGLGAAGVLYLMRWALPQIPERGWHRLTISLALLLAAHGVLSLAARSRVYNYNLPEFPGAKQAVAVIAPRLAPGDKIVVQGMSLTPFLYYAYRQRLPYLTYVYDHVLEGWEPLRSANRIFVVVNARKYTLADVLKEARLGDAPAPIEIATFEAGRVYLISRE